MPAPKEKLNGSPELFAQAVQGMFNEAVTKAGDGLKAGLLDMRAELKSGRNELLGLVGELQKDQHEVRKGQNEMKRELKGAARQIGQIR